MGVKLFHMADTPTHMHTHLFMYTIHQDHLYVLFCKTTQADSVKSMRDFVKLKKKKKKRVGKKFFRIEKKTYDKVHVCAYVWVERLVTRNLVDYTKITLDK